MVIDCVTTIVRSQYLDIFIAHNLKCAQVVALDKSGTAEGDIYMDDGRSFAFQRGASLHRALRFAGGHLSSSPAQHARGTALTLPLTGAPFHSDVTVERIVIIGLSGDVARWKVRLSCDMTCKRGLGHLAWINNAADCQFGPYFFTKALHNHLCESQSCRLSCSTLCDVLIAMQFAILSRSL